ncbi:hypothetical protein M1P56_22895 [Streptomyces sp. HU2014]|uniref:hypothetical protein n=1 Tax=Streptomyces sp. HU2014 TaxID=2939414 RepID=UPI00200C4661|nr:hypothetical protein [Streptomyces sp. HU2014]UQI46995.1 hypothetical protein M1P56_22895 [Streptomyces sp. HU2014]
MVVRRGLRRRTAVALAVASGVLGGFLPVGEAFAAPAGGKTTLTFSEAKTTRMTVPDGVTKIVMTAVGPGGGGGGGGGGLVVFPTENSAIMLGGGGGAGGAAGGYFQCTLNVTPGETLSIDVAGGGAGGAGGTLNWSNPTDGEAGKDTGGSTVHFPGGQQTAGAPRGAGGAAGIRGQLDVGPGAGGTGSGATSGLGKGRCVGEPTSRPGAVPASGLAGTRVAGGAGGAGARPYAVPPTCPAVAGRGGGGGEGGGASFDPLPAPPGTLGRLKGKPGQAGNLGCVVLTY